MMTTADQARVLGRALQHFDTARALVINGTLQNASDEVILKATRQYRKARRCLEDAAAAVEAAFLCGD